MVHRALGRASGRCWATIHVTTRADPCESTRAVSAADTGRPSGKPRPADLAVAERDDRLVPDLEVAALERLVDGQVAQELGPQGRVEELEAARRGLGAEHRDAGGTATTPLVETGAVHTSWVGIARASVVRRPYHGLTRALAETGMIR